MDEEKRNISPIYDAHPIDVAALLRMLGVGAVAGALGWLLYLGVATYFIEPVFCRSAETFTICRSGGTVAWVTAHLVVLAAAVAVLARLAIYRPLLVVLAVLASLWGAHGWLGGMTWYAGVGWQALLFAAAFAAFGWIARTANFFVALIATLAVVILSRVILMFA